MKLTKENKKSMIIALVAGGFVANVILPTLNGITLLMGVILLLYVFLRRKKDLDAWMKKLPVIELAMVQMATYLILFWATMNFIRWLFTIFA